MKRLTAITAQLLVILCLLFSVCAGCRHLQKGETERCPSCGLEYPAGTKHDCNGKHKE
ncbi:anaerobic ribonucleoside-triphosphate reductase [Geomonas sp. RF6]|uniref:anaerobic ribonucleoside-triphosphate reductase n=1 Tax=Geomonas sp. RF6 TaxID=2897342 RepID=UPI001E2AFD79|nr:anaerobic ribonucleoside-triphosphate reductase [Geomonas sp. RF6]UFS70781.1 anaerobic ribonucleoside-triphosphate reductase [Geomonas sp. RF6]